MYADNDDPVDVEPIAKTKKKKSNENTRKKFAQIETVGEILDAYRKDSDIISPMAKKDSRAAKQSENVLPTIEKKSKLATKQKPDKPVEKPTEIKVARIIYSSSSESETELVDSDNSVDANVIFRNDIKQNEDLALYYDEKFAEMEKEANRWKRLYEESIQMSKQNPLTEETGRRILAVLAGNKTEQPISLLASSTSSDASDADKLTQKPLRVPETIDLGSGVSIKKDVYDSFARKLEPSHFFSSLAQCVFGTETLANRCVRSQSNVKEPELEEDKKEIVVKHFLIWLSKKARYPPHLVEIEEKKISKYFNTAITSARKKVKRKLSLQAESTTGKENETDIQERTCAVDDRQKVAVPRSITSHNLTTKIVNTVRTSRGDITPKEATHKQLHDDELSSDHESANTEHDSVPESGNSSPIGDEHDSGPKTKRFKPQHAGEIVQTSRNVRKQKKPMRNRSQEDKLPHNHLGSAETVHNSADDENNSTTGSAANNSDTEASPVGARDTRLDMNSMEQDVEVGSDDQT